MEVMMWRINLNHSLNLTFPWRLNHEKLIFFSTLVDHHQHGWNQWMPEDLFILRPALWTTHWVELCYNALIRNPFKSWRSRTYQSISCSPVHFLTHCLFLSSSPHRGASLYFACRDISIQTITVEETFAYNIVTIQMFWIKQLQTVY